MLNFNNNTNNMNELQINQYPINNFVILSNICITCRIIIQYLIKYFYHHDNHYVLFYAIENVGSFSKVPKISLALGPRSIVLSATFLNPALCIVCIVFC